MKSKRKNNKLTQKQKNYRGKNLAIVAGLSLSVGLILTGAKEQEVKAQVLDNNISNVAEKASDIVNQGINGTSNWTLFSNGELHIGAGQLDAGQLTSEKDKESGQITGLNGTNASRVKVIVFDGKVSAASDSSELFKDLKGLQRIDHIENLDVSNVENMDNMFASDGSLKTVDLSSWNVSKVNSMANLFANTGLTSVNVGSWDVSKVTRMDNMFLKTHLNSLDLSKWNVGNVTSMDGMFLASPLKQLDVSQWNVENVTDMVSMFSETKLNTLDLSGWKCGEFSLTSMMLAYSPINILKVSDTVSLRGAGLRAALADGKNHATHVDPDKTYDPDNWLEVGSGTIEKPEGKTKLVAADIEKNHNVANKKAAVYVRQVANSPMTTTIISNVAIKTSLGTKFIKDIQGKVGDVLKVDTPDVAGYTKDKSQVEVTVNEKSITVNDPEHAGYVTYQLNKKPVAPIKPVKPSKPTHTSKPSKDKEKPAVNNNQAVINKVERKVATHSNSGMVALYNKKHEKMTDRALSAGSDWFSDQEMIHEGQTYYRVSTNEWVRAEDVYEYSANDKVINTNTGTFKKLVDSRGELVKARGLAQNTTWKTDRMVKINGKQYYRVSTNEFISTDDVSE
ncbi:BspA family leucine-rich repeat surface protein [Companilactobacillus kimchiensis]|uniref:S-layer protein C-terminal domain-containing protein n=1 Tax=Companilactobacillus kimchiensis TaxID=993692 RepID=A0A0R2LGC5_9LACO|nr:BspA family leucine-rich repeat surface protein [Companilactobacillus kimchiensis]KRO00857.1 hypothetical protein IV57_GL000178 [Companilactobacillus kimchiensis]